LVQDGVIFEQKSTFFRGGLLTLHQLFSKFQRSQNVVQRSKKHQKNLPRKISKDGGDFQDGVCIFLQYEIEPCERSIWSIELIFGLS